MTRHMGSGDKGMANSCIVMRFMCSKTLALVFLHFIMPLADAGGNKLQLGVDGELRTLKENERLVLLAVSIWFVWIGLNSSWNTKVDASNSKEPKA